MCFSPQVLIAVSALGWKEDHQLSSAISEMPTLK